MIRIFKSLLVCSVFSLFSFVQAQTEQSEILPLANQSLMLDVAKINDNQLIAVGVRGHILLSNDGENWTQQTVPTKSNLTKVYFFNENLGWAVGHDSVILHTRDGGKSWDVQNYQPEKQRPFFDIYFFNPSHGIAMGAYGLFYRTQDGGNSWLEEFHIELLFEDDQNYLRDLMSEDKEFYHEEVASILPHFNRLLATEEGLFLAGEVGMIAKSVDSGKSWQILDEIYLGSFFDISTIAPQQLLIVGLRGNIFTSHNKGEQWQPVDTNTTALLNDIVSTDTQKVFVLANSGVLLSSDNGEDFTLTTQPDGKALMAGVWFNNKLVVASEVGMKVVDVQ
ncbi:hypothetical protein A9Q98_04545 [Thalassotalea sp. 42_200_T64]|nr:hypothetical protein A9Q98_04545 [Thalassotalea sp. 42_200_T64]